MSSYPVNTGWFRLTGTAAGTQPILAYAANLETITVGSATTGTVTFYDSSGTTMGTVGTANLITSITGAVNSFDLRTHVKNGILAVVGGTVDCLISCG